MSEKIDLLPKNRASQRRNGLKVLRLVSLGLLGFVLISSLVLFILSVSAGSSRVKNEESIALTSLSSLAEKATKSEVVSDRTAEISQILSRRKNYHEVLGNFTNNVPPDVEIESFSVGNDIQISGSSSSLSSIDSYVSEVLTVASESEDFRRPTLESVNYDPRENAYVFSIIVDINER